MKFQVLDILPNIENPVTGRLVSTAERYAQALTSARRAEELGFDSVALGERHAGHFLSSGVTVTWAHHAIQHGDNKGAVQGLVLTVLLGISFSCVQAYEYAHAPFTFIGLPPLFVRPLLRWPPYRHPTGRNDGLSRAPGHA